VALGIAKKGLDMFRQLNIPILGIIENMSGFTCRHCGKETAIFKEGGGERLSSEMEAPFLGSIPLDPEIMLSGDEGVPVLERGTGSTAAQAFLAIASRVQEQAQAAEGGEFGLEPTEFGVDEKTGGLRLGWPDGHRSTISAYSLRLACGCASCIEEHTGRPLLDPRAVPLDIRVREERSIGRYGLTPTFTDGHNTGIYPHEKLRALCECPECSAARGQESSAKPGAAGRGKAAEESAFDV
jgi:ATP-binding protein involved in chromosome partitioning